MYGLAVIKKMNAEAAKPKPEPRASVRFNKTLGGKALAAILSKPGHPDLLHVNLRDDDKKGTFKFRCAAVELDFDKLVEDCEYDEDKVAQLVNIYFA